MRTVKLSETRQYTISYQTNYHVELKAHYMNRDDARQSLPAKFSVSRYINDNLVNRTDFHGLDLSAAVSDFESLKEEAYAKAAEYNAEANKYMQDVEDYRNSNAPIIRLPQENRVS